MGRIKVMDNGNSLWTDYWRLSVKSNPDGCREERAGRGGKIACFFLGDKKFVPSVKLGWRPSGDKLVSCPGKDSLKCESCPNSEKNMEINRRAKELAETAVVLHATPEATGGTYPVVGGVADPYENDGGWMF